MKQGKRVEIDGRYGEGGGQILRTALTLSAILRVPVHITHIRGRRKKPGLQPQHLIAVNALAAITGARMEGAKPDSRELIFEPGEIQGGDFSFHIGTAGSTGLVIQTLIPPCSSQKPLLRFRSREAHMSRGAQRFTTSKPSSCLPCNRWGQRSP